MITLYHGSNCDVTNPIPMKGRRGTDFGQGFYLTPDMDSARSMASLVTRRQGDGIKTISVFEFDIDAASIAGMAIRQFESMDADWMSSSWRTGVLTVPRLITTSINCTT